MMSDAAVGSKRSSSAGFTLLEVTICIAILAFAFAMAITAILATAQMNTRAEAEMLATAASEEVLAQVRQTLFTSLYADYESPGNNAKRFFTVPGLQEPVPGQPHGEVILILSETPNEAAYGRDFAVPGGGPGIDLNGNGSIADVLAPGEFQADIDGDGLFTTAAVAPANLKLIPVVVLVRWRSGEGIQRLQVTTLIVDRRQ